MIYGDARIMGWDDTVTAGNGEDHRDVAVIDSEGVMMIIMVVVMTTVLLMRVVVRVRTVAVVMVMVMM